jgi:hypothetical protein
VHDAGEKEVRSDGARSPDVVRSPPQAGDGFVKKINRDEHDEKSDCS